MTAKYDPNRIAVSGSLFKETLSLGFDEFLEVYRLYVQEAGGDPEKALDPQMFAQKHDIYIVPEG